MTYQSTFPLHKLAKEILLKNEYESPLVLRLKNTLS